LSHSRAVEKSSEIAQNAIDAPPSPQACWLLEGQRLTQEGDVRVTRAFKRLLSLPGASVVDVSFTAEGVVVTVRLRRRRRVCAQCGQTGRQLQVHDRRVKRWRHLDLEDTAAWLAQQMAFTPITRLLRIGWRTVGAIVERVVADHLDEERLTGLVCIGVHESSHRRHYRYLTASPTTPRARSCGVAPAATAPPCRASSISPATAATRFAPS
jgi:hypothetical protein